MFKIGDSVICPYNIKGVIKGFLSKEDVYVHIKKTEYKKKGKRIIKECKNEMHVYGIKLLKKI